MYQKLQLLTYYYMYVIIKLYYFFIDSMKQHIKQVVIGVIWVLIVAGGSFAAYIYNEEIVQIFSPGYSDSYSLEEVNEKIFTQQKKAISEIEKEFNSTVKQSESQKISWNIDMNLEANSSFGWGDGKLWLEKIDIQYTPTEVEILISWMNVSWKTQILETKNTGNMKVSQCHLITNASWSYIKVNWLEFNVSDISANIIPPELIKTLNKLWEAEKYVNLTENVLYDILQAQMKSQTSEISNIQKFALEFIKNEAIFEAYKQEDTKYHLAPSKALCTLEKRKVITENKGEDSSAILPETWFPRDQIPALTYDVFKTQYEACTNEEFQKFKDEFIKSDTHEFTNFYIELNTTKLHYIMDAIIKSQVKESEAMSVELGLEGTSNITKHESSQTYMRIIGGGITGSGILIEQVGENIQGYVDIDISKYKLETQMTLSGTLSDIKMNGNYTYSTPEVIDDFSTKVFQGIDFSWNIEWKITDNDYVLKINNSFLQKENGVSGDFTLDTNGTTIWESQTGSMLLSGTMKMWASASPISGNIQAQWDTQTSSTQAKWNINYALDIPNIASWKYDMKYDFIFSDVLDARFETPKDIIPEKNLNSLIMMEKRTQEKNTIESPKKGKDNKTILDSDMKINSDLRLIASALEINMTVSWKSFDTYINQPITIKTLGWILYNWNINYDEIKLDSSLFKSPTRKPYEIRVLINQEWSFYQIAGYILTDNGYNTVIKWNYFPSDPTMPKSLFDIEVQ